MSPEVVGVVVRAAAADADPPPSAASSSSSTAGLVFGPGPEGSWDSHGIGAPVVRLIYGGFKVPFQTLFQFPIYLFFFFKPQLSFSKKKKKTHLI